MNVGILCRLLGVDKLFSYAINEWLNDIKKNQLPGLLGGVGPIHSLVQLGEYCMGSPCHHMHRTNNMPQQSYFHWEYWALNFIGFRKGTLFPMKDLVW